MNHGLIPRDYETDPVGCSADPFFGEVIDRRLWPSLIAKQKNLCSSPLEVHRRNAVPILNQLRFKYCWCFAIVAGVMNRYAFQGINDPVDELSATAVAAQGKNFRNVGGHCSEAVSYCKQYGIPTADVWPNDQSNRRLARKRKTKESAAKRNIVKFTDLGADWDAAISCLIRETPVPVSFSLPWWRHAVLGLQVDYKEGQPASDPNSYELIFVNSYGSNYGDGGYGKLTGHQSIGQEFIAIENVTAGNENDR